MVDLKKTSNAQMLKMPQRKLSVNPTVFQPEKKQEQEKIFKCSSEFLLSLSHELRPIYIDRKRRCAFGVGLLGN